MSKIKSVTYILVVEQCETLDINCVLYGDTRKCYDLRRWQTGLLNNLNNSDLCGLEVHAIGKDIIPDLLLQEAHAADKDDDHAECYWLEVLARITRNTATSGTEQMFYITVPVCMTHLVGMIHLMQVAGTARIILESFNYEDQQSN